MGAVLLPLAYPFSLPLGASHWNFLVGADPPFPSLLILLFQTGPTILFLLLSLVRVLVQLLMLNFLELLLCSIPSLHLSVLSLNCLAKNLAASQSIDWPFGPFGPFVPPSFSTVPPSSSIGLTDSA